MTDTWAAKVLADVPRHADSQGYEPEFILEADALAALTAQLAERDALRAKVARLEGALRWAHDTLWEINPSNYDHDEVCKLNDASVEVILGIAPLIGETHGKSPEWWAERAALTDGGKDG